jgi:hypothetical protein
MRVTIWDMDWFHKQSFIPNHKAQKISSFHKQKGDIINFVEESEHLTFEYDLLYIIREKKATPFPPRKYIDKQNIKLVGVDFDFYDNYWDLTSEMKMVRPDYLLYEVPEKNAYANAHVIQMLDGTKFLPLWQDPTNAKASGKQKTYIVDEKIWELEIEDLTKYFDLIKNYKDIAFAHPISLKRITTERFWTKFKNLHFQGGTIFKFKNDFGSEYSEVKQIIDKLKEFKELHPHMEVQGFPVKAVIYDHWKDKSNGIKDLKRLLKITDYAKRKKIQVIIKTPKDRMITPYWFFFDMMENWTTDSPHISYVEMMLLSLTNRTKKSWQEILNDPIKWSVPRVDFLLHVITKYPEVLPYAIRKWGENCIDVTHINFKKVVEFTYNFEKEDTLNKIGEAIKRGEEL